MKILLVEDHPGLAKISCDLLRNFFGHDVEHAATGEGALSAAVKSQPDLILIDLHLPDMHGYRLAEKIREDSRFDETILVALTGHGLTGTPERSLAVGIDAHYRKPMDFSELEKLRRRPVLRKPPIESPVATGAPGLGSGNRHNHRPP